MPSDSERPATIGSDHKRRGTQSPETAAVLADYRVALRDELAATILELRSEPRPKPADRARLAALAIKLARHLETGSDPPPTRLHTTVAPDATRGTPARLTRRERARLE